MDVIRFTDFTESAISEAEIVSGMTSVMWVESYQKASQFTIKGPISSDLRRQLPIGSFISHMDSNIPMIVEDHSLTVNDDAETQIQITGRSLETIFENRIVGATGLWTYQARDNEGLDVSLLTDYTWNQIMTLLHKTIYSGPGSGDIDDDLYGLVITLQDDIETIALDVATDAGLPTPEILLRSAEFGTFYDAMMKLLAIDNLGVTSTWRPWDFGIFGEQPNMRIIVFKGLNRTEDVVFSDMLGDLESAEYLWSLKSYYTAALAKGRWVSMIYKGDETGWDRRYAILEAEDIDSHFESVPVGADLDAMTLALYNRAKDTVMSSRATALAQANSRTGNVRYQYRKDYNVGDIVRLEGDYDEVRPMQVVEYVEIDDETGESGYPTFAPL